MMQTGFLLAHRDVEIFPDVAAGFLPNLRTVKIFQGKRQVKNRRRGTGGEGAAVHGQTLFKRQKNEKKTMKTKIKIFV